MILRWCCVPSLGILSAWVGDWRVLLGGGTSICSRYKDVVILLLLLIPYEEVAVQAQDAMPWELTVPEHWHLRARQGSDWAVFDEWWWENCWQKMSSITSLLSGWWCQVWVLWPQESPAVPAWNGEMDMDRSLVPVFVSEVRMRMSLLCIVLLRKTGLVPPSSLQCLEILNWE